MTNYDILFNHFLDINTEKLEVINDNFNAGILLRSDPEFKQFYNGTTKQIELKSDLLMHNIKQFNSILDNAEFNEINHSLVPREIGDIYVNEIVIEFGVLVPISHDYMVEKSKNTANRLSGFIENKPNSDGAKRALNIINSYKL